MSGLGEKKVSSGHSADIRADGVTGHPGEVYETQSRWTARSLWD